MGDHDCSNYPQHLYAYFTIFCTDAVHGWSTAIASALDPADEQHVGTDGKNKRIKPTP
jgi:hypothetical protein